jgi:hypothetical protein
MDQDNVLTLISEDDGSTNGFLIATLIDAPPVFDPGGKSCMIDDFVVACNALWDSVGTALLDEARVWAKREGAAQIILVTPKDHPEKNAFVTAQNLKTTTFWWTEDL